MASHWMLVVELNKPAHVRLHWMDHSMLVDFGIEGKVGDVYQLDENDVDSKRHIVGKIKGRAAELLDMVVDMVDFVEGGSTASQELRYNIAAEMVEDVVRAVERARK